MVIFDGFSHIHGVVMAFYAFLTACEYSSVDKLAMNFGEVSSQNRATGHT